MLHLANLGYFLFCIVIGFIIFPVISFAQKGYIYVHVQAVNEDASPTTGFPFDLTGGPTTVPTFTLNDRPDVVNASTSDIGAGHGTGEGDLWSVTNGILYRRAGGSSQWVSTQTITGTTTTRVDGGPSNVAVYISANKAYYYNGTTTTTVWNPTNHLNVNAADIAYANGYIVITGSDGSIWRNSVTAAPYTDNWIIVVTALTGAGKIDMSPITNNIVFTVGTTIVDTANLLGSIQQSMTIASVLDVAFADDGGLYTINSTYINKRTSAGAWTQENTSPNNCKTLTGGPGGQVWTVVSLTNNNTIFTRSLDGSGVVRWIDDERVRLTYNDNSIMIPVTPGTYTLTETKPTSWDILGELVYDPTNNSSVSPATNSATLNVSAGEVVHVIMQNERLIPVALQKQCAATQVVEDFGSAPSTAAYVGAAPVGLTSYHYYNNQRFDDGSYSIANNSVNWPNGTLLDHTLGTGVGLYMLVNASFQQDEFYRKRVTNLVPGISYKLSFWAASLSSGNNSIITAGIADSNTVVLGSYTTPGFNGSTYYTWKNYTFTFTATTSQGDIFLRNGGIGGGGNDLALDDITLTPQATSLTSLTVPTLLCSSSTAAFGANPSGGLWTTSNSAVATINSSSGLLTTKTSGTVSVRYQLTNAIGCLTDTSVIISVNQSPVVTATGNPTTSCINQTINLNSTATGGTTPYGSYAWSTSAGGNITGATNTQATTAAPAASGTYTYVIAVTDAGSCVGRDTVTIAVTSRVAPTVTVNQNKTSLCGSGQTVNLTSVLNPSTGSFTYAWSATGTGAGLNTPVNQSTASATPTTSGSFTYTLSVTDANGCTGMGTSSVIKASPTMSVAVSSTNPKLCSGQSLTVNSTPSGGITPYTYAWTGTPTGANITSSTTIQNITAQPTAAGNYTYSVVVTDANSCTVSGSATAAVTLSSQTAPTVTASASATSACSGQTTITLTANRSNTLANYSYTWTGSGLVTSSYSSNNASTTTTALPTATGTYSVTVTDGNGCSGYGTTPAVTVNPLPVVSPTATYISSNLCSGQSITLASNPSGGTGAVTAWGYAWTQSTGGGLGTTTTQNTTASPPAGGTFTYNVVATDTKGCISNGSVPVTVTVSSSSAPTVTASVSGSVACAGQTPLTLTANRSTTTAGSYSYTWTGSGITNPTYSSTATSTTTTATPAVNGVYTVKVTDGNNCSATASTGSVTVRPVPSISASSNSSGCLGGTLNLLSLTSGGTSPYTYAWTASATAAGLGTTNIQNTTAKPTATGSYTYNIGLTDNNGCTATSAASTTIVSALSVSAAVSATSVCTATNAVSLTSSVSGGTSPYTYSWTGSSGSGLNSGTSNQSSSSASPTTDGSSYALLVVDAGGCSATGYTSNVTVRTSPSVSASTGTLPNPFCKGLSFNLFATASGGTGVYNGYLWTGSGINTGNQALQNPSGVTPSASGTYSVTVTDKNGCTASGATSNVNLRIANVAVRLTCYTDYAELEEYGGSAVSWLWTSSNPQTVFRPSNTISNPTTTYDGTDKVVITDAVGCKDSALIMNSKGLCAILPVTLVYFRGEWAGPSVVLQWMAENETGNSFYEIERSSDLRRWQSIGKVMRNADVTGNTYQYKDQQPPSGKLYYRLKQVDQNGKTSYSGIIELEHKTNWIVSVFPNPAVQESDIVIQSSQSMHSLVLYDMQGRVVFEKVFKGTPAGSFTIHAKGLLSGNYIARITALNKQEKTIRLVVL